MEDAVKSNRSSETNQQRQQDDGPAYENLARLCEANVERTKIKTTIRLQPTNVSYDTNASKQFVDSILSNPQIEEEKTRSEEIEALSDFIRSIHNAVENDILSQDEATALTRHAVSSFVSQRVDELIGDLFSSKNTNKWLFAASQHFHE